MFHDALQYVGMTEALRAQIKERLQANNLCSDGHALEEQEATTLAGSNIHLHIARLRLDSAAEEGSVKVGSTGGTPLLRSRKNVRILSMLGFMVVLVIFVLSCDVKYCIVGKI